MKDTPAGHMPFSWKTGTAIFAIWFGILIAFVALKDTVADIRPLAVLMQFYVAGKKREIYDYPAFKILMRSAKFCGIDPIFFLEITYPGY